MDGHVFPTLLTEKVLRTRLGKLGTPKSHRRCMMEVVSATHSARPLSCFGASPALRPLGLFANALNSPLYSRHTFFHLSSLCSQHLWCGTRGQRCVPQSLMTQVQSPAPGTPSYTKLLTKWPEIFYSQHAYAGSVMLSHRAT